MNAALADYQAAIDQAASGTDYDAAKAKADEAAARVLELCTTNGYNDIASCIGQDLPPVPPAPEAAPAEQAAPAETPAEAPAATEEPAATDAPAATEAPADAPADQPAPAAEDPNAQIQADLNKAAELYGVGASQLDAGDPAGQSTVDAANQQFADICAAAGLTDVAACLAQFGIELPPLPETPVAPAEPAGTPIADLPGSNEEVTPEATEVLPESVAPEIRCADPRQLQGHRDR